MAEAGRLPRPRRRGGGRRAAGGHHPRPPAGDHPDLRPGRHLRPPDHVTISSRATEAFRRAAAEPGGRRPSTTSHGGQRSRALGGVRGPVGSAAGRGAPPAERRRPPPAAAVPGAGTARRRLHDPRGRPARDGSQAGRLRLPRQPDPRGLVGRAARDAGGLAGARVLHPRRAPARAGESGRRHSAAWYNARDVTPLRADTADEALLPNAETALEAATPAPPAPRRRGSPAGSKNRPKPVAAEAPAAAAVRAAAASSMPGRPFSRPPPCAAAAALLSRHPAPRRRP